MRSNSPRVAMLALATTALLPLFSAPVAIADEDHSTGGRTGAFAHGPLPPPGPVKDYSKNGATGNYSAWRGAAASREPVSASPVQDVTAAKPGDAFDWDDAAIGAGVGVCLALVAGVATAAVARRRIALPTTEGLAPLTRAGANERRSS
jgi:hypothetical protein